MSLFLVTDSEAERLTIEKALRNGGYGDIFFSTSLDDAYEKLAIKTTTEVRQAVYDVALILISLTSKSETTEACRRIKASVQYQDIPVLVFSDSITPEDLQAAFAFGASDFLVKPVRDFELLGRVRYALKLKHEIDRRKARERELLETTMQLSDLNSLLTRLSMVDSLTGIGNRRCFDISFDQEWRRAARNSRPISLALIDVDFFKLYNDTYGHQAGDECLKTIVIVMRKSLKRPGDLLSRYGGEEFAIILPDTPGEGALVVANSIHESVKIAAIPHPGAGINKQVTLSIGLASVVPNHSTLPSQLVEAADRALYQAKVSGRNQIKVSPDTAPPPPKKQAA